MVAVVSASVITCPACGVATTEVMPATSCVITYRCPNCGAELWPAEDDCCVYCTYGSVPCQPVQRQRHGGAGGLTPSNERRAREHRGAD